MPTTTSVKMPGTPPRWANSMVSAALRTPGIRKVLGRAFAVITVTGSRTGRRYSTPVQYMDADGHLVVLSQVHRRWWRNLRARPGVELLVRGREVHGDAVIAEDDRAADLLSSCLARDPKVARFYGVEPGPHGSIADADMARLLDAVVVIDITPDA
jgi:deazaflavin-dependent oxidoreductase (nitroreductase family)